LGEIKKQRARGRVTRIDNPNDTQLENPDLSRMILLDHIVTIAAQASAMNRQASKLRNGNDSVILRLVQATKNLY
jgi:hypothetical protein